MIKNVLITGGAGFIGSRVAKKLVDKGYFVRILDNMSEQIHGKDGQIPEFIQGRVDFIKGDVCSYDDWKKALDGMDAVIHLAAQTGTGQSMYEIARYCDINIGGTAKMLDILTNEEHSIKKVIIAASRAIYGEGMYRCKEHGIVYPDERKEADMAKGDFTVKCPICGNVASVTATDESTLIHPSSVYGITKQVQEELALVCCKAIGIPAVTYRYQNVYGPGQSLSNPYTGILSIFSTRIRGGKDINIFEDGMESRDFVYIDDVVDATIAGLENKEADYQSFNVGTGVMTTVNEVVEELMKCYGKRVEANITGMYRAGDIRNNYADVSKAKKLLGFEAKTSFAEGIKKFAEWVDTQEEEEDRYEESLREMKEKGLFK